MSTKLDKKTKYLVSHIPRLIKQMNWAKDPDLFFYKRTLAFRRQKSLTELFDDKTDRYLELIYATLVSWNMNSRAAKMKYFDEFKASIVANREGFIKLSDQSLDNLSEDDFRKTESELVAIYSNLDLMKSGGKLVSASKTMHFIVPDLVMPIDRQNTLNFFFGNTGESKEKFLDILQCSYDVARRLDLRQFLDKEWNQSITKVIDNAIIQHSS